MEVVENRCVFGYTAIFMYADAHICIYVHARAVLTQVPVIQHGVGVGRDGG